MRRPSEDSTATAIVVDTPLLEATCSLYFMSLLYQLGTSMSFVLLLGGWLDGG